MTDVSASGLRLNVDQALHYGTQLRLRYYTGSQATTGYDDDHVVSKSGTDVWSTGLKLPLRFSQSDSASHVAQLVHEGKLLSDDSVLYLRGSDDTSGTFVKVGIGSPVGEEYFILGEGVQSWDINNESAFKKMFIRVLPTGSVIGEA